jgi:hypothetical protein
VFFVYRLIRGATPALRVGLCALLAAVGVALVIWGLVGHSPIIAIRGVIELVVVAVIALRLLWPSSLGTAAGPGRRLH